MNIEPRDEFERQLTMALHTSAPADLRCAVLGNVERELRAARWDRRLARAAMVLLVVGIGLNAALVLTGHKTVDAPHSHVVGSTKSKSLVETAIVVAEATNVETGRQFARQMAALNGRELTDQEIASIDAATRDRG